VLASLTVRDARASKPDDLAGITQAVGGEASGGMARLDAAVVSTLRQWEGNVAAL